MFTSQEIYNLRSETVTGVNSRFAVMTEEEISQMPTFLDCVVLSLSSYTLIQLFSESISVTSGF